MRIAIERFSADHEPAAAAFNRRLREGRAPTDFVLPERATAMAVGSAALTHYVAVDEGGELRGGVLCQEHPAIAGGRLQPVVNIQSPISEGIIDRRFAFVAPQLIRHVTRLNPLAFAVGMGSAEAPIARLLRASGWRLHTVPFFFRLIHPARCLRELRPLRRTKARRLAAAAASATGVASLGSAVVHRVSRAARREAHGFDLEPVSGWSAWADAAWQAFVAACSFGVCRTSGVLPFLYRDGGPDLRAWRLTREGVVEGWFGLAIARQADSPYFGGLTVATLTDCIGTPAAVRAGLVLAVEQAQASGADLVITNQLHKHLQEACAAAGWRRGPSNYVLAVSPALAGSFDAATAYVTRRDGDGLTHLVGHGSTVPTPEVVQTAEEALAAQ
ncbi:MAG TPA: hypothetical protein VNK41_11175 [Vicinamibacterales bacterium]|nr:hypothetical protein [Vicinamibacterales bacterium]